jgi:hypothetical protein
MHPYSRPAPARMPLPISLRTLRKNQRLSLVELAERTGLSRMTLAAAEGAADTRLSTITTAFDALGFVLMPVPKEMATEVAAFVADGGVVTGAPAGVNAPVNAAMRRFQASIDRARHASGDASGTSTSKGAAEPATSTPGTKKTGRNAR